MGSPFFWLLLGFALGALVLLSRRQPTLVVAESPDSGCASTLLGVLMLAVIFTGFMFWMS
jgi:hypothetical protein